MIATLFSLGLIMLGISFLYVGKNEKENYPKKLYHLPWYFFAIFLVLFAIYLIVIDLKATL